MALSAPSVKSDINVTPLVDVVLVLLIIFMVVTPMLQKGQAVQLPLTANPSPKPDEKSQIMVVINQFHEIWIEKDKTTEAQFSDQIKEAFERNPSGTVVVKADAKLTFGDVKKLVFEIRDAGFKGVGLISEKRSTT